MAANVVVLLGIWIWPSDAPFHSQYVGLLQSAVIAIAAGGAFLAWLATNRAVNSGRAIPFAYLPVFLVIAAIGFIATSCFSCVLRNGAFV